MEEETVVLNYYTTTLYPSEYEKTIKNGGYIKIPYLHGKGDSEPNIVHDGKKYKTETMFIVIADPTNKDYDGELVIRHVPITNGDMPVYLVIPLKTQPTVYEETPIDKIIQNSYNSGFKFDLGELIGYNKIISVNTENIIYVLSPMFVKSVFNAENGFKHVPQINKLWQDKDKLNFRQITLSILGIKEGFVGGARPMSTKSSSSSDVIYDCTPILENGRTPAKTIEVMPVTSQLAKNVGTLNVLSATNHFFIFLIMILVATITAPLLYKITFVDYIKQLGIMSGEPSIASLKMLDYIFGFLFFMFATGISIGGMSFKSKMITSIGGLMAIFVIISIGVISYYKKLDPIVYSLNEFDKLPDDFSMFGKNELFLKIDKIIQNRSGGWLQPLGIYLIIFIIGIVTSFMVKFDKNKKKNKAKRDFTIAYISIFGFFALIYAYTMLFSS
jgi:hypothetical protein